MDREPVTIPAEVSLLDAQEQFFLRYRWPWFVVVDPARHFLGVVRQQRIETEIAAGRPALTVSEVLEQDLPVQIGGEAPLESLLGSEGLGRLGAMVAVDSDGVLRASSRWPRCAGRCDRPLESAIRASSRRRFAAVESGLGRRGVIESRAAALPQNDLREPCQHTTY